MAGYRAWQKLERQVRQGEKGIQILAPVTRTVERDDGREDRVVVGFRVVHVFDVSQTDGKPLPDIRPTVLQGALPTHWGKVEDLIRSAEFGLEIADAPRLREAYGVTDWKDRTVVVRKSMPGAQRFKTAVHELAHIRLHQPTSGDRPSCRGIVEVEAESVAYMVCAALGVDSAGYSLPYVAAWSGGDLQKVSETADRVIHSARQLISEIEIDPALERDRSRSVNTNRNPPSEVRPTADDRSTGSRIPADELVAVLDAAVSFYQEQLRRDDHARAFPGERGIGDESVQRWQLGYAPRR